MMDHAVAFVSTRWRFDSSQGDTLLLNDYFNTDEK